MTITGLISPSGVVKSIGSAVGDVVIPGPSAAEREVDALFDGAAGNPFWTEPPRISTDSKTAAVAAWDRLRPDREHAYPTRQVTWSGLGALYTDLTLDGRLVRVRSYVSQVYTVDQVPGRPGLKEVSFRLSDDSARESVWCGRTVVKNEDAPLVDQLVEVTGMVVARGSASTADGGFMNGSMLVCPRVEPQVAATDAVEVAELFRVEEGSTFWSGPPTMSSDARTYLMENWPDLTPYAIHGFPDALPPYVETDRIFEDDRFDGRLSRVSGFVSQRVLSPAGPGTTSLRVRLQKAGQDAAIWCRTTVQNGRMFHQDDHLEAVGVPYARGSATVTTGDLLGVTMMVCPAMRRIPA